MVHGTRTVTPRRVVARNVAHPPPSAPANVRPAQVAISAAVAKAQALPPVVHVREEIMPSVRHATAMNVPAVRVVPAVPAPAHDPRDMAIVREHAVHDRVAHGERAEKANARSAKGAANAPEASAHGHPPNARAMPL